MKRVLAGVLLLAAAVSSWGYETLQTSSGTPLRWSRSAFPVFYHINQAGSDDVSFAPLRDAITASFGTWQAVSTADVSFQLGSVTAQTRTGNDGVNLVRWYESEYPFEDSTLAVTVDTFNDVSGQLLDADINVNGVNFRWSAGGGMGVFDVQNVITHEAGHLLGLGHSTVPASTMYADASPGETSKRTLHADDVAGLVFLYPLREAPPVSNPGDVNRSGRVDGRDLVLLALAFGASAPEPRYLGRADFNADGRVDGEDLAVLSANFGALY